MLKNKKPVSSSTNPGALTLKQAAQNAGLALSPGKSAIENKYRHRITASDKKTSFTGSIDLDAACRSSEPSANRWDYAVGLSTPGAPDHVVWIEPHSGDSASEVNKILDKLDWLEAKLSSASFSDLRKLTNATSSMNKRRFHWLSSGQVGIRAGSREANKLAARGLAPPASHLKL